MDPTVTEDTNVVIFLPTVLFFPILQTIVAIHNRGHKALTEST